MDYVPAFARWLHFMAGVMWIGLLYYFNFVQVAALKAATADGTDAGITKHVVPRALLFFRWAAVVTWLAGAALLGNQFVNAFTLAQGHGRHRRRRLARHDHAVQRVGHHLAQPAEDPRAETRDRRGKEPRRGASPSSPRAPISMLSIPMLFFMAGGWSHRAIFGAVEAFAEPRRARRRRCVAACYRGIRRSGPLLAGPLVPAQSP